VCSANNVHFEKVRKRNFPHFLRLGKLVCFVCCLIVDVLAVSYLSCLFAAVPRSLHFISYSFIHSYFFVFASRSCLGKFIVYKLSLILSLHYCVSLFIYTCDK
jgi:hypothetical protein